MNVVYTFDEGYSSITAVSMISLLINNKEVRELNIYIVDCGISTSSKEKFQEICARYNRNIFFVDGKNFEKRIPIRLDCLSWSFVCYVRLFFCELFPNLDKILHIDCDTIIRGKLEDVYTSDISNYYCAACYDCLPSIKYAANFFKEDRYYSNGFILFNLNKMRQDSIQQKFINYIVEKQGKLPHLDQDVVNAVLKNKIYTLHPRYNLMTYTAVFKEKSCVFFECDPYYNKHEISEAIQNPLIIHYVGFNFVSKPWLQPCYHPYNDEWVYYYKKTRFDEELNLIKYRKKKYGIIRESIIYIWNVLFKYKTTNRLLFLFEKFKLQKKLDNYKRG
ncbi:glycosyltransferase family 8 protein [Clostridium sp. 3-3]|uniref:glycosyltransferase family 8 protein n=1 Tax=Clostridium sp. 3-3 TaxID=2070757 RepID=UPI000CDA346D|nr:glycosyltransferase family 8 protein [Clostridium sp. 3-3]POO85654.1 hypothetical protein C1H59_14880 [Clostridium sp. 3-3]